MIEIWSTDVPSDFQPLFKKQKAAIRILAGDNYNGHTEPLFTKIAILSLTDLITCFILSFSAIVFISAPTTFHNIWITNRDFGNNDDIGLINDNEYYIPRSEQT